MISPTKARAQLGMQEWFVYEAFNQIPEVRCASEGAQVRLRRFLERRGEEKELRFRIASIRNLSFMMC